MLDRLKRALVESFVGAIALGYLLAQGISALCEYFCFTDCGLGVPKLLQGVNSECWHHFSVRAPARASRVSQILLSICGFLYSAALALLQAA